MSTIVSYVRVSTQRQGASGLGLDAQRAAVDAYCKQHGVKVGREFQEVESGRNDDRAVLREAIAYAKRTRSKLVIGKLDRLARSVSFISNVMDSGIDFAACDVPEANRLLLHIMAAVAENEAKAISDRTIAALAAAKARGTALGATNPKSRNMTPEVMEQGRALGVKAAQAKAQAFYADVAPMIDDLRAQGLSLPAIAEKLTAAGFMTRTGKPWNAMQVLRVLQRSGASR